VTSFFGIKGGFFYIFLVNNQMHLQQTFFRVQKKTLVHYNLYWKAMHQTFNRAWTAQDLIPWSVICQN